MSQKMHPNVQIICPACGQDGQGKTRCPKCDADLEQLMVINAHSYVAREAARRAIRNGQFEQAYRLARKAQTYRKTPAGEKLMKLALMNWDLTI